MDVRYRDVKLGYRVGDDGSVWSCWTGGNPKTIGLNWHQMKPATRKRGYRGVFLGRNNSRLVHHLVLEAFVGPCPPGLECRHLDGNPANNRLDNLCWGTHLENHQDAVRHGTASPPPHCPGEKQGQAKLTTDRVREASTLMAEGVSQAEVARRMGVSRHTINDIVHGRSWRSVTQELSS